MPFQCGVPQRIPYQTADLGRSTVFIAGLCQYSSIIIIKVIHFIKMSIFPSYMKMLLIYSLIMNIAQPLGGAAVRLTSV